MGTEQFGEMPRASEKETEKYQEFLDSFLRKVERKPEESEGFLYIPPENILIIPGKDGGGILEIREPEKLEGIDDFSTRDAFEKGHLVKTLMPEAEWQNSIFQGITYHERFHPQFGGRFSLSNVKISVSTRGATLSIPVLPDTGQRYGKHAKLPGSNLVRGKYFPRAEHIIKGAAKGESNTLEEIQKANPQDRIISQHKPIKAGFWTLKLTNKTGTRTTEIPDCNVYRDPDTGTFEVIRMEKQFIFQEEENLDTKIHVAPWLKRVHMLVSYEKLKKAQEGQSIEIEKLYFDNKLIENIEELPKNYQHLFEKKDGKIFLKSLSMVPPLRAFQQMEQKIVDQVPGDAKKEIRIAVGKLFEEVVGRILDIKLSKENEEAFDINRPLDEKMKSLELSSKKQGENQIKRDEPLHAYVDPQKIGEIIRNHPGLPKDFISFIEKTKGTKITIRPDFVFPDGTFVEVKLSSSEAQADPIQLYRMILYLLIEKRPISNIRYYVLENNSSSNQNFPEIKYENIFEDENNEKIIEKYRLMKSIEHWKKYL